MLCVIRDVLIVLICQPPKRFQGGATKQGIFTGYIPSFQPIDGFATENRQTTMEAEVEGTTHHAELEEALTMDPSRPVGEYQPGTHVNRSAIPNYRSPHGSRLDPIDFRALEYIGSYDHNLMCAICHCPFMFPVKLDCEHVFCQRCVNKAMRHQNPGSRSCPSCRRKTEPSSITAVPKILDRILDELLVRCPLRSEGCLEELPRCGVQDHVLKYCDYFEVDCPSGACSLPVQRKDADGTRCLHYSVGCTDCKQSIMKRDLESHRNLYCDSRRAICPDCKDQLLVCDLEGHIEHCLDAIFPCTASGYGCDFIAKRTNLDTHLKRCALAKLMPFLKTQNDRLEAHEAALKHLRHKNSILETSFANIQETLNPSTSSIDTHSSSITAEDPGPFNSTSHHLLCLHESLREEVNRVSVTVSEIDARASMMVMSESLRAKEDFAYTNAAIGGMRAQLHWLVNARLQDQQRVAMVRAQTSGDGLGSGSLSAAANVGESSAVPIRRLSDSARQETKL